jgi:hypothetical protein
MTIPNFPDFDAIDNNNNFTLKRIKQPTIINNNVQNDSPPQELLQFTRAIMCPSPMPANGLFMPKALKRYSDSPTDAKSFWRNHYHIVRKINKP